MYTPHADEVNGTLIDVPVEKIIDKFANDIVPFTNGISVREESVYYNYNGHINKMKKQHYLFLCKRFFSYSKRNNY